MPVWRELGYRPTVNTYHPCPDCQGRPGWVVVERTTTMGAHVWNGPYYDPNQPVLYHPARIVEKAGSRHVAMRLDRK